MASDFERLNIILAARDREFARAMDRNTKRIERFTRRANSDLSKTSRAFTYLARGAAALAPALAAAFSFRMVQNSVRLAKEISNQATLAGLAASEFQRLSAATRTVGISAEKLSDIYKDVNDRVGEFLETGGGPMKDFFEYIAPAVGVTADQFARLSGPEALQLYVDTLERAGVNQQEMTFYMEAMASDTAALIPLLADGGKEMRRLADEAEAAGRVLDDETIAALSDLETELFSVKEEIRNEFMKAVADSSDEILALADFVRDYGVPALQGLIDVAGQAATAFDGAATAISEMIRLAKVAAGIKVEGEKTGTWSPENFGPDHADPDGKTNGPGMLGYVDENGNWVDYGVGDPAADTPVPGITGPVIDLGTLNLPPERRRSGGSKPRRGGGGGGGKSAERLRREEIRKAVEAMVDFEAVLDRLDETTQGALGRANDYATNLERITAAYENGELSAQEYRKAVNVLEDEFAGVISATEALERQAEDLFAAIVTGSMSGREALGSMLDMLAQMAARNAFGALFGDSGIFGSIASWFPNLKSFDGGGSTGGGARMGGLDGKGGYLAMVHPRETIVDHTKGQTSGGGGRAVVINQTNQFTSDIKAAVRAEMKSYAPQLIEATKAAVADQARRSPGYRRAF